MKSRIVFALAVVTGLFSSLAIVTILTGCHNHPNRSARLDPGDVNGDGVVDELDLDTLEDLLGIEPEVCDPCFPLPGDCNLDTFRNFGDFVSLHARLRRENRCGPNCREEVPRPHPICGEE